MNQPLDRSHGLIFRSFKLCTASPPSLFFPLSLPSCLHCYFPHLLSSYSLLSPLSFLLQQMSTDPSAYKKVIGGGLKFKGGGGSAGVKKKSSSSAATAPHSSFASGTEKALGLSHTKFKKERPDGLAAETDADSAAAASAASAAAGSSGDAIAPPVVLGDDASAWKLHKKELHEVDANLRALRDADRNLDKLEPTQKKGPCQPLLLQLRLHVSDRT